MNVLLAGGAGCIGSHAAVVLSQFGLLIGEVHHLHNPGASELEIIEIQSGIYLGEDDIERLEDIYGRDSS